MIVVLQEGRDDGDERDPHGLQCDERHEHGGEAIGAAAAELRLAGRTGAAGGRKKGLDRARLRHVGRFWRARFSHPGTFQPAYPCASTAASSVPAASTAGRGLMRPGVTQSKTTRSVVTMENVSSSAKPA